MKSVGLVGRGVDLDGIVSVEFGGRGMGVGVFDVNVLGVRWDGVR